MSFPVVVRLAALIRAGGRCECRREGCDHDGRCNAVILFGGFEAHHRHASSRGGPDAFSNCEILCAACHQNTQSYGRSTG